jgi:PAS domain S-box-containing protein
MVEAHDLKKHYEDVRATEKECQDLRERLEESHAIYRALLDATPDPVVVNNTEGKVSYLNPAFTEVFGWSLIDMHGKPMNLILAPNKSSDLEGLLARLHSGEKISDIESCCLANDGRTIPVSISGNTSENIHGEMICSMVIIRDISTQKSLETQVIHSQKMEAIGTLAGGIAHDFNNILAAMMGYTELAKVKIPDESPAKSDLQRVLQAGHRAKDLVNQILTFGRQGEREIKPVPIDNVVKEALKLLRASLPATIEIRQHIQPDCGNVSIDPTQIHQILMNLCSNAHHAMRENGGILEVRLANLRLDATSASLFSELVPGRYVMLSVSDTGNGMPRKVLERIFDPYFTTKEKDKGTGLGLAVVHGIVNNNGGHITVESDLGKGTSFFIYFPSFDHVHAEVGSDNAEAFLTGNEQILFVDDEVALAEMGKQILEHLGYHVITRTSSIEALELFRSNPHRFDLVITDMTMPNMTGEKLAKNLMAIRPDIPVILCTGFSEHMDEDRAKEMGIREFAMKPLIMGDLAKTIREVLA